LFIELKDSMGALRFTQFGRRYHHLFPPSSLVYRPKAVSGGHCFGKGMAVRPRLLSAAVQRTGGFFAFLTSASPPLFGAACALVFADAASDLKKHRVQEAEMSLLGIQDPWVWLAYLLCILSTILFVIWGAIKWNSDDSVQEPEEEVRHWAEEEEKVEEEL
jgi:hypothetical protein